MLTKDDVLNAVKTFKAKHGVDGSDENLISAIHCMNQHGIDANAALDQSSRSGHDFGIDAWFYDNKDFNLYVYQSKLSTNKNIALKGLLDFKAASEWLANVIVDDKVETIPQNPCLYNLYNQLAKSRNNISRISFILLSLFDKNELLDSPEYDHCQDTLVKSRLNQYMRSNRNGSLAPPFLDNYNLQTSLPRDIKKYSIRHLTDSTVDLRVNARLELSYVSLVSLIELYRQRGDALFEKNVRLSLIGTKKARDRLVHPLNDTFDQICNGNLLPNIFPFYHVGITISASSATKDSNGELILERPNIINGCQTITIANEFYSKLQKGKSPEKIDLFKQIRVIAKVVVGISDDELKEITNSNNRQNPIENWQLFSNEQIHNDLEHNLEDIGIFYERQEGKFLSTMDKPSVAKKFYNTNKTCIRVVEIGQLVALCKRELQFAAKPSDIFLNKQNHYKIFTREIVDYPRDIVSLFNLLKALRRGLSTYLSLPIHANNDSTQKIFKKPIVQMNLFYLGLIYFYQKECSQYLIQNYSLKLNKIAPANLVEHTQTFFTKIINKTKKWYMEESQSLTVEVSKKKMDLFTDSLISELGIDIEGSLPFTNTAINWSEYDEDNQ
jgi:predicted CopG family antitoxin